MAIAPSKLGHLVSQEWHSERGLLDALRQKRLVRPEVSDEQLLATLVRAREEHAAMSESRRYFNSPHERVRVFLAPLLTNKGMQWAMPLRSLDLPED